MSLVLTGPRRIYVLLLFRERLGAACATLQPLRRLDGALGAGMAAATRVAPEDSTRARLIVSARVHRRWRRSVIGLSFFVLVTE